MQQRIVLKLQQSYLVNSMDSTAVRLTTGDWLSPFALWHNLCTQSRLHMQEGATLYHREARSCSVGMKLSVSLASHLLRRCASVIAVSIVAWPGQHVVCRVASAICMLPLWHYATAIFGMLR
jgi:hypothetical protein